VVIYISTELDISGFKDFENRINSLNGEISLGQLFSTEFMQNHTKFASFDELISNSGFKIESEEDISSIPKSDLNKYISDNTNFNTWEDMLNQAGKEYAINLLNY
jgi:hypothetical protein